ncbi:unnamed protein product [Cylicostephanus goldi]|uniref:Uncharacterized protein n=1 Tax=Cylicostephanus goldi TaxID=71465 RepID=A0A3P6SJH3_CYLGO|nr:unnamed protein product [Cylicostephanus goldi]
MFDQSLFVSNQYKIDVEADLLKTAQELEQIGFKALSEIELAKKAWREKINVGVGSRVKVVDVSTTSSEGIGGERLNTAQPLTGPNPLASEMQMQQAQASSRKRMRRPSLAEVEIPKDLNSDDFVSPKSSKISDLTQTSLLTSHADDEESKNNASRKSDIKSDNTPYRRRRLPRPFQSDVSMVANKMR